MEPAATEIRTDNRLAWLVAAALALAITALILALVAIGDNGHMMNGSRGQAQQMMSGMNGFERSSSMRGGAMMKGGQMGQMAQMHQMMSGMDFRGAPDMRRGMMAGPMGQMAQMHRMMEMMNGMDPDMRRGMMDEEEKDR